MPLFTHLLAVGRLARETGLAAETILKMDAQLAHDLIEANDAWADFQNAEAD